MTKKLKFLSIICLFISQAAFGQGNSASHSITLIMPELASLGISNHPEATRPEISQDILMNYSGALYTEGSVKKERNVEVQMLSGSALPLAQELHLIYSHVFADQISNDLGFNEIVFDNLTMGEEFPLVSDFGHEDSFLKNTGMGISYRIHGANTAVMISDMYNLQIQYTLSDF
ncbi:hypothetical protein [uncultured Roseivirga sp.]|mgnify:FL=1|uniref:hypothetical protein n=1 Tax=uncultured Roseivirga sp. TaxID=543088 RepID=UPI0030D6D653|tara:strand:+ start:4314 stop:4835 length:522 start_codon:yes stop_codon:yes gene_type:complete